jgi:hypothetical protein
MVKTTVPVGTVGPDAAATEAVNITLVNAAGWFVLEDSVVVLAAVIVSVKSELELGAYLELPP